MNDSCRNANQMSDLQIADFVPAESAFVVDIQRMTYIHSQCNGIN